MRSLRVALLLAATLIVSGCLDNFESVVERVGVTNVRAYLSNGTPVVRGSASFYLIADPILSPLQPTPCALYEYSSLPVRSADETLDAGASVTFANGGSSAAAQKIQTGVNIRYEMSPSAFVSFSAGDSITVSIPGAVNGFEAMTAKVRLAEPFTVSPIVEPAAGQPIALNWTAAPIAGSMMVVSFRYSSIPDSPTPNLEIGCVFIDVGFAQIPGFLANGWVSAPAASKSYVFTRLRETTATFDSRTRTRLRSFFDVPTPELAANPTVLGVQ